LDALDVGVSHALGTGGRDLSAEVDGLAARQGLALLAADPSTRVIVLVSKPPAPAVAGRLLAAARPHGEPPVAWLLGVPAPARRVGDVWFASSPADAAELAATLVRHQRLAEAGDGGNAAAAGAAHQAGEGAHVLSSPSPSLPPPDADATVEL